MHVQDMLRTHPLAGDSSLQTLIDCVSACYSCAQACTSCADACLGEEDVADQSRCIRLNLDCADVCTATGALATRMTERVDAVLASQLRSCVRACRACAEECEKHASHMEHCRVCATACRACERACEGLLGSLVG